VLLFILYRNNKNKEKANNLLSKQKEEINIQKNKVEQTLTELKSTQAQLIQSEKMASLGELTAGIAHEIQNPLNFVNNFSEVSKELAEELKEESQKPEIDKGLIAEIATDIADNQTKIHHHGNRASSIVKGMLEHSRTSYGKKELTDINTLADEYLRLSYHGLRAKNKDFNAEMVTDFDPNLPKIEVIPQDTGRVLLNLINNAFQAVDEQSKKGIQGYKPTVTVSTKYLAPSPPERAGAVRRFGEVEVTITDNGPGISDEIKDKIFQPFFTTKDTGKGTGLGLSLAYDIVKAHGGELTVDSTDGEGSAFIINLPLKA
jgi:two-component system NtrC family sensor kinase